jgi:hypothetical protein
MPSPEALRVPRLRLVPLSYLVPQSDPASFWAQVRTNVVSWLIIAAVGGTGYIAYTVPRMLQLVLEGQERLTLQTVELQKNLASHERRLTLLELRQ